MNEKHNICILGYDALEIELVEKFDFPNLKQAEYGKNDISDFETIFTPILWGSFLTGENLEPYFREEEGSKFLQKVVQSPYRFLKKNFSGKMAVSIKDYLGKLGLVDRVKGEVKSQNVTMDLNRKTIFDFADDSMGINIPSFNKKRSKETSMKDRIEGKISDSEFQEGVWSCFEKTEEELLENLDKDLIMAWFGPADWIGHVYRGNIEVMEETYSVLNRLAGTVKDRFDGLVLIVSDHGMKRLGDYGDHTDMNYGFYSSSIEMGLENPKITDFYEIIKEVLSGDLDSKKYAHEELKEQKSEEEFQGDEEEELKKRLKDLGYFD